MKKWAIAMANAVGGQTVEKTPLLKPSNPLKVVELTQKFVTDYNIEMLKAEAEYIKREGGKKEDEEE